MSSHLNISGLNSKYISTKALIYFIIPLMLSTVFIVIAVRNKMNMDRMTMERLIIEKSVAINDVVTKLLYKTQALASLVIQNDGAVGDFDRVAATIIDDPSILNILLAPGGVVSDIFPMAGSERALGLDFFSDGPGNLEARLAKEQNKLFVGGPFTLVQGGEALVGRLPVWLPKADGSREFWGLVSVTLKYPDVLNGAGLDSLTRQGYIYEIWRINPDDNQRQIIAASGDINNNNLIFIEQHIKILNADWYFRIAPLPRWYEYADTWLMIMVGLILSSLVAINIKSNEDLRRAKFELEHMVLTDPLTRIFNRKGLFKKMEELIAEKACFMLSYLDLNYFKQINDNYGHNRGDYVLGEFSRRILKHVDSSQLFARVSGDEFVLLHLDPDPEKILRFWDSVEQELKIPVFHDKANHKDIYLSFSRGEVCFPDDALTTDELINLADQNMYEIKRIRYSREQRRRKTDWDPNGTR
jgi:diguanylate cyclase (GGDEF) domain